MVSASCGFVVRGKTPVVCGYGDYFVGGILDQLASDICKPNLNVKIVGVGARVLDDISIMDGLPHMEVFVPDSAIEVADMFERMMGEYGPGYLKL